VGLVGLDTSSSSEKAAAQDVLLEPDLRRLPSPLDLPVDLQLRLLSQGITARTKKKLSPDLELSPGAVLLAAQAAHVGRLPEGEQKNTREESGSPVSFPHPPAPGDQLPVPSLSRVVALSRPTDLVIGSRRPFPRGCYPTPLPSSQHDHLLVIYSMKRRACQSLPPLGRCGVCLNFVVSPPKGSPLIGQAGRGLYHHWFQPPYRPCR